MAQPQEGGQVRDVVGMKMADGDQRQIAELCLGLAEAKEGSAANVDKYPRLRLDPEEITGRRAIRVDAGATRTQDLYSYRIPGAALRQRAGWDGEKGERADNYEFNHERVLSLPAVVSAIMQCCASNAVLSGSLERHVEPLKV
jgi:hypothetical protein